ncbi:MAG: type II secretion system protein E [Opitutia bacterium Tous-C2FEB]|nr:MAG: type II secretion system protein E [Opitutae bacterium Tous-C2FEB]PAZ02032.1 MAG: type II secretion system protein E [Opitutae bacterium AMD-G3]
MTTADDFVIQFIQDKALVTAGDVAEARAAVAATPDGNPDTLALANLVENGKVTWSKITEALGVEFDMEVVDLSQVSPADELLKLISRDQAERSNILPLQMDGVELLVAIADPLDTESLDSLARVLKLTLNPKLAPPDELRAAIARCYSGGQVNVSYEDVFGKASEDGLSVELPQGGEAKEDDAPIIRYVNSLIVDAIRRKASDIHLEPLEKRFRVRFRIDGVLQEMKGPPKRLQASVISRLKLMAEVSLAEKRIPQDGRIQARTGGRDIDLRVSVLPTVYGESIVMRILDKEGLKLGLPELGFFADDQAKFQGLISGSDGVFLVTGPTGSGKSTTLYSALNYINKPDRKIITVEDPVEYQMAGINQVQVKRDVGMTFAAALRAMLRQAPNIVMIGEIRDLETAEIAINAALTGHMVFSTLHTNDSVSAVTRLVDIGVKPFLVSAALRGALAQRLVRRVCQSCAQPYKPTAKELYTIGMTEQDIAGATPMKGAGCAKCGERGYKGRRGVFELFVITEEIQEMIYSGSNLVDLRRKAREAGMRTMREDGQRKVASGMTTIEEVMGATVADDVI